MDNTAPKWIELPSPLHWREVAAGEPERSRHPTSQTLGPEMPDWTEDPKARAWDEPPPPYDWRNPPPYQGSESSPELPMNGLYGSEGKGKDLGPPPEKLHWREVQRRPANKFEAHQGSYMMAVADLETLRGSPDFGKGGIAWNKPVPVSRPPARSLAPRLRILRTALTFGSHSSLAGLRQGCNQFELPPSNRETTPLGHPKKAVISDDVALPMRNVDEWRRNNARLRRQKLDEEQRTRLLSIQNLREAREAARPVSGVSEEVKAEVAAEADRIRRGLTGRQQEDDGTDDTDQEQGASAADADTSTDSAAAAAAANEDLFPPQSGSAAGTTAGSRPSTAGSWRSRRRRRLRRPRSALEVRWKPKAVGPNGGAWSLHNLRAVQAHVHQRTALEEELKTELKDVIKVRKRHFVAVFILKKNILPRQARDKHRWKTQKKPVLSQEVAMQVSLKNGTF